MYYEFYPWMKIKSHTDHAMKILEGKHDKKINKEKLRNFDLDKYVLFVKSLYEGKRYESWDAYISQGR